MTGDGVYLDHAATAPLRPEAADAMAMAPSGNPGSVHGSGRRARAALEDAREEIAALLGAQPLEIVLTSGGTEADTLAVMGAVQDGRALVSAVEHPAVAGVSSPWLLGGRVGVLPVDRDGRVDPEDVDRLGSRANGTSRGVDVVSVMTVNNETGVRQPVTGVAEAAHRIGALAHTDAVQAVGHVPVDPVAWGVDLMSVSAHKIGGPVGIGALWMNRGVELHPVTPGGGQQYGLRSGTQPVALAMGFAAALRASLAELGSMTARWSAWRRRIEDACAGIDGVVVDGGQEVSPSLVHLTVSGARGVDLVVLADRQGIDLSAGSACHAGVQRPSATLLAMGRDEETASSGLRISMGHTTTDRDVDALLKALPGIVATARRAR